MCAGMAASDTGVVSTAGGVTGLTLNTVTWGAARVLAASSESLTASVVCGVAAEGDGGVAAGDADSECAAVGKGTMACRYQHLRWFTESTR